MLKNGGLATNTKTRQVLKDDLCSAFVAAQKNIRVLEDSARTIVRFSFDLVLQLLQSSLNGEGAFSMEQTSGSLGTTSVVDTSENLFESSLQTISGISSSKRRRVSKEEPKPMQQTIAQKLKHAQGLLCTEESYNKSYSDNLHLNS